MNIDRKYMGERIKKYAVNSLMCLASIVLAVLALEVGSRFTRYAGILAPLSFPRYYYVKDAELGYDLAKNFPKTRQNLVEHPYDIWTNEMGCFDAPYWGEEAFIYLTGDSFTWGYAPFEDKWGTRLERFLATRVLKCGVAGAGTKYELIRTARQLSALSNPSLILVGYDGNDVEDDNAFPQNSVYEGYLAANYNRKNLSAAEIERRYKNLKTYCINGEAPKNPRIQAAKCWLHNNSIFYSIAAANKKLLGGSFLNFFVKSGVLASDVAASVSVRSENSYQENFQAILRFKKLAVEKGARLLFVLIPSKKDETEKSGPGINDRAAEFLKQNGIDYLDLRGIFQSANDQKIVALHWPVDGHWNIAGNHLAGFAVAKYIIERDFIKVGDKIERINMIDAEMKKEFGGL